MSSWAASSRAFGAVVAGAIALTGLLLAPRIERALRGDVDAETAPAPSADAAPPPASSRPNDAPGAATTAEAPPPKPPPYVRLDPAAATACPPGMLLVDGIYCPFVAQRCTRFVDEAKDVCQSFAPDVLCEGALQHRRFCVDALEYPNLEGVRPAVNVDYVEARRGCAVEGKRLCTTEEWAFACEGPEMWPYPYGRDRDATACNIDQVDPGGGGGAGSLAPDAREPAGRRPRCISPFGALDMTGNVAEWVEDRAGGRIEKPFRSAQKGGGWGVGRATCRPTVSTHEERFRSADVGFRCCSDTTDGARPVSRAGRRPGSRPSR